MTYCTLNDLNKRFGEDEIILASAKDNSTELNTDAVDLAIADAAAEINGYIGGRNSLPLASVPDILNIYACDIARYRLTDDRTTDEIESRYNNAIKYLKMVSEGKVSLGFESGQETDISARVVVRQGVSGTDWGTY